MRSARLSARGRGFLALLCLIAAALAAALVVTTPGRDSRADRALTTAPARTISRSRATGPVEKLESSGEVATGRTARAAIVARGARIASPSTPRFADTGALERPRGFEEWIFVGASLGLSYAAREPDGSAPQLFHNVYLEPRAYRHFVEEGSFPDGTVLVLELLVAARRVAPSRHGLFEGRRIAVEAAVKDRDRFAGGWAYFDFGLDRARAVPEPDHRCAACHREHAARDHVFTQFYPVLRRAQPSP